MHGKIFVPGQCPAISVAWELKAFEVKFSKIVKDLHRINYEVYAY